MNEKRDLIPLVLRNHRRKSPYRNRPGSPLIID